MSLERAYKNCMACYTAANYYDLDKISSRWDILVESEAVAEHMNEAMKALEETGQSALEWSVSKGMSIEMTVTGTAIKCIRECMNCDFKKSRIAEIIDEEYK